MNASLERVGALARKEFRHLSRDPRLLAVVLLLPIVQLLVFAYAISFDVDRLPTVVVDQDRTPASRAFVAQYRSAHFFDVTGQLDALPQATSALVDGRARVAVVVPGGFEAALAREERAQVGVMVDGSDPNAARIAATYAAALNRAYDGQIAAAWADRHGLDLHAVGAVEPAVRTWYNPERSSTVFLVPGLMAVIIMIVTVQQTAVTLVRERDLGTAEQMAVSPLRPVELMVGKLLPWTLLAFVDVVVITALGVGLFGVPLRGSVAAFGVGAALFVFSALALGLIVSALAPSVETANIAGLLVSFLPAFLLSGFAFPLAVIPVALQWLSYLFPGRYLVSLSRDVFLKGAGFPQVTSDVAALGAYAVAAVGVAVLLYRRRAA